MQSFQVQVALVEVTLTSMGRWSTGSERPEPSKPLGGGVPPCLIIVFSNRQIQARAIEALGWRCAALPHHCLLQPPDPGRAGHSNAAGPWLLCGPPPWEDGAMAARGSGHEFSKN